MSFLGTRNAVAIGVSQHLTLGGPDLLSKLSPSLILQFAGAQTMDPRITFTRSTTATFTGSNGLLQTAAIDAPRFDYNPATLAPLGLLIEEQRTNLLLQSGWAGATTGTPGSPPVSPWSLGFGTGTETTLVNSIYGTADGAQAVRFNADSGERGFFQQGGINVTSGVQYALSVYLEQVSGSIGDLLLVVSGTTTATQNTLVQNPSTPGRYTVLFTANGTGTVIVRAGVGCSNTVSATCSATLSRPQLEAGAFATSYIPTVASQVTRAADVAVMTGTNFSSWYNATEGTLYAEAALVSNSGNRVYLDIGPNGAFGTTAYIVQTSSAVSLAPAAAPVNMASSVNTTSLNNKVAAALQANNAIFAANGGLGTVDTNCAMPVSATQMVIGNAVWSGGGTQINGHIRRIAYYPRRLSNAALQGITS